jgi:hypothetical protein
VATSLTAPAINTGGPAMNSRGTGTNRGPLGTNAGALDSIAGVLEAREARPDADAGARTAAGTPSPSFSPALASLESWRSFFPRELLPIVPATTGTLYAVMSSGRTGCSKRSMAPRARARPRA